MKKNIGIVVLLLTIIAGGLWGIYATLGSTASAQPSITFVAGSKTTEVIENMKSNLDKAVEYELAYGCVQKDRSGQNILCGKSKEKIDAMHADLIKTMQEQEMRDPASIALVTKNIKDLVEDSTITVSFVSNFQSFYSTNPEKRNESYTDNKGREFWIDLPSNKVIQFGPSPNSTRQYAETGPLKKEQLKTIAIAYLTKHIPDFGAVQKNFEYTESTKDEKTYFFRWNAPSITSGEEIAGFVQVGVTPTGEIASFNDTRSTYEK